MLLDISGNFYGKKTIDIFLHYAIIDSIITRRVEVMAENFSNGPIVISVSRESYFRIIDSLGVLEHTRRVRLGEQQATKPDKRYMSDADMALEEIEINRLNHLRLACIDHFYETMGVIEDNRIRTPITESVINGRNRTVSRKQNRKPKGKEATNRSEVPESQTAGNTTDAKPDQVDNGREPGNKS
jgi:hypothetical protein